MPTSLIGEETTHPRGKSPEPQSCPAKVYLVHCRRLVCILLPEGNCSCCPSNLHKRNSCRSVLWSHNTSGGRNHGSGPLFWVRGNSLGGRKLVRGSYGANQQGGRVAPDALSPPFPSPSVCLVDSTVTVTVMLAMLSGWSGLAIASWNL